MKHKIKEKSFVSEEILFSLLIRIILPRGFLTLTFDHIPRISQYSFSVFVFYKMLILFLIPTTRGFNVFVFLLMNYKYFK